MSDNMRERLMAVLGSCSCCPGGFTPDTYEGPQEDCPMHGSPKFQVDAILPLVAEAEQKARAEGQDSVRDAILQPHIRESTEHGPDFCRTCSEAISEWVAWPCAAVKPAQAEVRERVEAVIECIPDVREFGERGTPFSNGARHLAGKIRAALGGAE